MGKTIKILLLSIALSLSLVSHQSWANKTKSPQASSKAEAAQIAKSRVDGKVLKVQYLKKAKPPVYKVKILTDQGTVKVVKVLAQS